MSITWKQLENYSKYSISNTGLVRNNRTKKLISGSVSQGYVVVTLYPDSGEEKPLRLHRLVALLFHPNENNYPVVNHIDGNPLNNNASNLEWSTVIENTRHAVAMGLNKANNIRAVRRISSSGETKEYASVKEAHEDNKDKIKYSSYIVSVCSGKQKTAGGYGWEYIEKREIQEAPEGKVVVGFENYIITPQGTVYSKFTKNFISPHENKAGYLIIDLQGSSYDEKKDVSAYTRVRSAKRQKFRIHRLVAEYYIPNPNNYPEVNHRNKDRKDNRVSNLEWVTSKQNLQHAHNKSVFQYNTDWELVASYESLNEADEKTGINHKNISSALRKGGKHTAGGFFWTYEKREEEIKINLR
jgi:hypothetical protein